MNIIKIEEKNKVKGYDNIYLIHEQGNDKEYIANCFQGNYYLAYDNNDFLIYEIGSEILSKDLRQGVTIEQLQPYLYPVNSLPPDVREFINDYNEAISFFDLIKIFDKYGFDFVGEKNYLGDKGTRLELSGKGDFESMMKQIKEQSKFPEKIIDGGQGHYKYAPQITRKSIIVLN